MALDIKRVLVLDEVGPKCTDILGRHNIIVKKMATLNENELMNEIPVSVFFLLYYICFL